MSPGWEHPVTHILSRHHSLEIISPSHLKDRRGDSMAKHLMRYLSLFATAQAQIYAIALPRSIAGSRLRKGPAVLAVKQDQVLQEAGR
jgi:hypothetical protein